MAPETQRDAQAVASEFVIRVERDDQRAPRAVDVQAAVGSTDCLAPVSIRQERDPLLRALLLAAQPHPAEQGLSQEAVVHHIGWRGWQTGVMRSSTNDQRAPHALHDNRICNL